MKLIGISFVVISAASVGIRFSLAVKKRCELIGQLIIALRMFRSELSAHGTPLPEAFAVLAAATNGPISDFFAAAARAMAQKRWISPSDSFLVAEKNLADLADEDPVRKILREFSVGLGKFDLDSQLQSVDNAISRLEMVQQAAEQDKSVRCKTYRSLGICAGLALAILLA